MLSRQCRLCVLKMNPGSQGKLVTLNIHPDDPLAVAAVEAIRSGDLEVLKRLLRDNPSLATARIGKSRTLLHVATDWPGNFPNSAASVAALIEGGAEVNA